jgi:predicted RNase H-like HicB family nuclease
MNNYSFNVFWSEEDQSYIALCPEFPRLSAFGDTPEQALSEMKIVLELAIETYQVEGWPLPEPRTYSVAGGTSSGR